MGWEIRRAPSSLAERIRGHPFPPSSGQRQELGGSAAPEAGKGPFRPVGTDPRERLCPGPLPPLRDTVALGAERRGVCNLGRARDLGPRPVLGAGGADTEEQVGLSGDKWVCDGQGGQ